MKAHAVGTRHQFLLAIMVAMMKFAIFFFYTFAFIIGSIFIQNGKINDITG
jgi:hypothetical protein